MHIADQQEVIPLWPNGAPGSEDWTQQEQGTFAPPPISFRTVRNVTNQPLPLFFRIHRWLPVRRSLFVPAAHSTRLLLITRVWTWRVGSAGEG